MSEKGSVHLLISGRVQGVCFRAYSEEEATRRGLTGWVRNTSDGRVEMLLEGEKEKIEGMIAWCRQGPPAAKVKEVEVTWQSYQGNFPDFRIAHSGTTC